MLDKKLRVISLLEDSIKEMELYRRVAFNICIGNGDDHFRNHGFLLSPRGWTLAPAYDLNPSLSLTQALMISDTTNESSLTALRGAHEAYFLSATKADSILAEVKAGVRGWPSLAKRLHLLPAEVALFADRLNRFA